MDLAGACAPQAASTTGASSQIPHRDRSDEAGAFHRATRASGAHRPHVHRTRWDNARWGMASLPQDQGLLPRAVVLPELLRRSTGDPWVAQRSDLGRQSWMRARADVDRKMDLSARADRYEGAHLPLRPLAR